MVSLPDPAAGVFGISVAASMVGTGVQNLRAYERAGLVEPSRTPGGTRLYSTDDIERLRRIAALLDDGLNLASIAMVLDLQDANEQLRRENAAFLLQRRKH
jgi:MerR family transcriptional regulator, heat shock protein HspR